jgi:periplasmic protein TonB
MSALSSSRLCAADLAGRVLQPPPGVTAPAPQRHALSMSPAEKLTRESPFALVAVTALHLLLLMGLAHHVREPRLAVVPPAVVGMLVTAPPKVEPLPLPIVDQTRPVPQPVVRRQPTPSLPTAAPSKRAVTASPPELVAPVLAESAAVQAPPSPAPVHVTAPAPAPVVAPEPVVPPRADAAHLNNPAPAYPPISRRLGEQGRVQLDVYILADGSVGEIKLRRSSGYAQLDQAALEAVRNWRYEPARRGNEAIAFWYVQPVTFSLDG